MDNNHPYNSKKYLKGTVVAMNKQRKQAIVFSAVFSAASILLSSLLFSVSRMLVRVDILFVSRGSSTLSKTSAFFFIIYSYLIFTAISGLFIRYNTSVRECWLAEHSESMTLSNILSEMFHTPEYLVGIGITFILGMIPFTFKNAITDFVHYGEAINYSAYWVAEFLEYVPFYLVVYTFQSVNARNIWMKKRDNYFPGKQGRKNNLKHFLKNFFFYSAILLVSAVLLSNGLYIVLSIFFIIAVAASFILFVLSFFPALFRMIRGYFQERKFISGIESICKDRGWISEVTNNRLIRLIFHSPGQTVSISANGKTIQVKSICIPDGLATVHFGSNGKYQVTHKIGFTRKITFFSFVSEYHYDLEQKEEDKTSSGRYRHLILIPSHPSVWLTDQGKHSRADNGSVMGDYRLWSTSAFLRALERGVEDRIG